MKCVMCCLQTGHCHADVQAHIHVACCMFITHVHGHMTCLLLDVGQAQYLAELRSASVLFVNLFGLILDTDTSYDPSQAHSALCAMQRVLSRNQGYRRQFLVDDKGCTLIGVFGVPPFGKYNVMGTHDHGGKSVGCHLICRKRVVMYVVDAMFSCLYPLFSSRKRWLPCCENVARNSDRITNARYCTLNWMCLWICIYWFSRIQTTT